MKVLNQQATKQIAGGLHKIRELGTGDSEKVNHGLAMAAEKQHRKECEGHTAP